MFGFGNEVEENRRLCKIKDIVITINVHVNQLCRFNGLWQTGTCATGNTERTCRVFITACSCKNKGVPKLTQDLNLIENTVFSIVYVIFLLNYKVHRIGLFVE